MRGTPVHVQPSQFPRKRLSRELWSSVSSTDKYWGLEAQSSLSPLEWTKLTFQNEIWEKPNFFPWKTRACIYRKIFDYFTFGAVMQFTIRISCKRVRIWPRYWVYFYYRNPKSGRDLRPRVYGGTLRLWWRWGTRRPCEWGHDWDQKNPSNWRRNRKQIFGSKIYPNKFHAKFLNR